LKMPMAFGTKRFLLSNISSECFMVVIMIINILKTIYHGGHRGFFTEVKEGLFFNPSSIPTSFLSVFFLVLPQSQRRFLQRSGSLNSFLVHTSVPHLIPSVVK